MLIDAAVAELVARYADLLAHGWKRRTGLLASRTRRFDDLLAADRLLLSYAEALAALGPAARGALHARRDAAVDTPLKPGEVFAIAYYALTVDDQVLVDNCGALAAAMPHLQGPMLAAIEWAPDAPGARRATASLAPAARLRALASCRHWLAPGQDAVDAIIAWVNTLKATPANVAAYLDYLRHGGQGDGETSAMHYLPHPDPAVKLAAAQLLAAIPSAAAGSARAASAALTQLALAGDAAIRAGAVRTLAVCDAPNMPQVLAALAADDPRLHLMALGWHGDLGAVPVLYHHLDSPALARIAAAALTLLTGSDPVRDGWQLPPALGAAKRLGATDADDADADDAELPWPDRELFLAWWTRHYQGLDGQQRHLGGLPLTRQNLARQIQTAPLAWRPLIAQHLQRLGDPDKQRHTGNTPLFPLALPAFRQQLLFSRTFPEGINNVQ